MKIIDVRPNDVFLKMVNGITVYRINKNADEVVNLMYCTFTTVLKEVKDKRNGFFIVESEE